VCERRLTTNMPASVHSDDQPMQDANPLSHEEQVDQEDILEMDKYRIHIVCPFFLSLCSLSFASLSPLTVLSMV
jgi:hypothetical protein